MLLVRSSGKKSLAFNAYNTLGSFQTIAHDQSQPGHFAGKCLLGFGGKCEYLVGLLFLVCTQPFATGREFFLSRFVLPDIVISCRMRRSFSRSLWCDSSCTSGFAAHAYHTKICEKQRY